MIGTVENKKHARIFSIVYEKHCFVRVPYWHDATVALARQFFSVLSASKQLLVVGRGGAAGSGRITADPIS